MCAIILFHSWRQMSWDRVVSISQLSSEVIKKKRFAPWFYFISEDRCPETNLFLYHVCLQKYNRILAQISVFRNQAPWYRGNYVSQFAPYLYSISKDTCILLVRHRWHRCLCIKWDIVAIVACVSRETSLPLLPVYHLRHSCLCITAANTRWRSGIERGGKRFKRGKKLRHNSILFLDTDARK